MWVAGRTKWREEEMSEVDRSQMRRNGVEWREVVQRVVCSYVE